MNRNKQYEEQPLRTGTYGMVAVKPLLTVNELARIDAQGVNRSDGLVAKQHPLRRKKAEKLALQERAKWDDNITVADANKNNNSLPTTSSFNSKTLSKYSPPIPWHVTSVPDSGLLNPFGVSGYPELKGPLIGRSTLNGNPWYFDAWSPYVFDKTNVNGWVAGTMGSGKSMFLKAFATRETTPPWNRSIIIEGDPNNEWSEVAKSVGGQVIQVGNGNYLNPLDPGTPPQGQNKFDWQKTVLGIQRDALDAIAHVLRPERRLSSEEIAVISSALNDFMRRETTPTITTFIDLLQSNWIERTTIRGLSSTEALASANSLTLLFDQVVRGVESGAFEKPSTITIDPNCPMLVFNTGSVSDKNEKKKQLYMAAMSAIVERLCSRQDGIFRLIIAEEGHELLKNPVLVDAWEHRIRMSGHLGVSNWILLHELSDLDKFAEAGTEQRNKINSILTLSGTQVIYRQSATSLALMKQVLPDLTTAEAISIESLPTFSALWRIGKHIRDEIEVEFSPAAYSLMRNDKNRA